MKLYHKNKLYFGEYGIAREVGQGTKEAERMLSQWKNGECSLSFCYERPSYAKTCAANYIATICEQCDGWGLEFWRNNICSFGAGFLFVSPVTGEVMLAVFSQYGVRVTSATYESGRKAPALGNPANSLLAS